MRNTPALTRQPREAELSRQRQHAIREQVITPQTDLAERNQFAEMIRAGLIEGRRPHREEG